MKVTSNNRKYQISKIIDMAVEFQSGRKWLESSIIYLSPDLEGGTSIADDLRENLPEWKGSKEVLGTKYTYTEFISTVTKGWQRFDTVTGRVLIGHHRSVVIAFCYAVGIPIDGFTAQDYVKTIDISNEEEYLTREHLAKKATAFLLKGEDYSLVAQQVANGTYTKESDVPGTRFFKQKAWAVANIVNVHNVDIDKAVALDKETARAVSLSMDAGMSFDDAVKAATKKETNKKIMTGDNVRNLLAMCSEDHPFHGILKAICDNKLIDAKRLVVATRTPEPAEPAIAPDTNE